MSNIFKFYINNNNNLNDIYIFIKNKYIANSVEPTKPTKPSKTSKTSKTSLPSIDDLNLNYNNYKSFIFSDVYKTHFINDLNHDDLNYLKKYNSKIVFVDDVIYIDDTIETIKLKFIKHYNSQASDDKKICFEELYFYSLTQSKLNKTELFNNLTNNNKNDLTRENFIKYLTNIYERKDILENLETKEIYTYDDIESIRIENIKEFISIGQSLVKYSPSFIVNPYNYSAPSMKQLGEIVSTNNSNMLFDYNIFNNTIYACIASNMFKASEENLETESMLQMYFHFLYSKNIINERNYIMQKTDLVKKTNELIDDEYFKNKNKFFSLLTSIYNNSNNLSYESFGIKNINVNINSAINYNVSLETLFKLFTSSELYPFIKYNPGKKMENLYRLYCYNEANNKKVPILNKTLILKYAKFLGKSHTLSFYVNSKEELFINNVNEFLIELDDSGVLNLKIDFKNIIDLKKINTLIATNVNNIIKFIRKFVVNNTIDLFDNLLSKNVEVNSINYTTNINIKGAMKFSNITNCISYLFNVISTTPNELVMRYKHVSNFSIMDSENSFIIELIKQKSTETDILHKLQANYNLSIEEARTKLIDVINSLKLLQNTFNHKKITIKNNPGFLTTFKRINSNNLSIEIQNIDNIYYLDCLPVYLDSIIKILFNNIRDESSELEIKNLCKKTQPLDDNKEKRFTDIEGTDNASIKNISHLLETDDEYENITNNDLMDILLDNSDDTNSSDDTSSEDDNNSEDTNSDGKNEDDKDEKGESILNITDNIQNNNISDEDDDNDDEDNDSITEIANDPTLIDIKERKPTKANKTNIYNEDEKISNPDETIKEEVFKEISEKSNPILKRLINREPKLFTTDKNKFYTEYSRLCPANVKKQPVILTKEEKEYIDINHRNSYTESYEYGTKEGNKYYYICPRYWDLEKNISLTHQEVESGSFGKVITKKNKDGVFNGNIMEFTDSKYHLDEKKKYIDHVPGFLDEKHNRNGFCLPCCFNNKLWNKSQQKLRRSKCLNLDYKISNDNKKDYYNYIKGPEKMPLEKNKIGFLQISIQKILQFDNLDCVSKQAPNLLKNNRQCLLRYGVENSTNQSFIACIADLYETLVLNNTKPISINNMKNIIINSITLDSFIKYNNGNLPHIFISKNFNTIIDTIKLDKYFTSNIYKELVSKESKILDDESHIIFIKKIVNSFENFKTYLESDSVIDYTYLWDIICKSNTLLFPNGLNLIILDITNEDSTDNVKIICPKQTYSSEFIDLKKKCLLLIQKNGYFEPIYLINNTVEYHIIKTFSFAKNSEDMSLTNFKLILNKIRTTINLNCISSLDTRKKDEASYDFKPNIALDKVITIIIQLKYEITYQILDYNNKVIGILVNSESEHGFIPCYPSALSTTYDNIPYKMIDDVMETEYNDYASTKSLLENIYKLSNFKIVSKPLYKIIDDNLVVGIITLGNQFVILSKPEFNNSDDLDEMIDKDYLYIDKNIQTNLSIDNERVSMVNNIKLETQFYNNFKNTFKKILAIHRNNIYKASLLRIINNNSMLYLDKISNIYNLLKTIGQNYIEFSKYPKILLDKITKISTCLDSDECGTSFCMKKNDICSLIIPETNLINNEPNEEIYYTRLSDEFVRYNRFKNFIFENNISFNYGSVEYNILQNELLLFHSALTQDYFKEFPNIARENNLTNTYDTLGIIESKNILNFKHGPKEKIIIGTTQDKLENIQDYYNTNKDSAAPPPKDKPDADLGLISEKLTPQGSKSVGDSIKSEEYDIIENIFFIEKNVDPNFNCDLYKNSVKEGLRLNFKETLYELYFHIDNKICSFQIILILIKNHTKQHSDLTVNAMKKTLADLYKKDNNFEALCYILLKNNKKTIIEKVINKELSLEDLINSDEYYISYIDIYMLAKKYDLPIIFLCNSVIDLTISDENFIICNINKLNQDYYIIKIPSKYSRKKEQNYKLFFNKTSIKFNIDTDLLNSPNYKLFSKIKKQLKLFINPLEKYINNYDLSNITKTKYKKKQTIKIEIKA
jgi:hypothetical protein